MYRDSEVSVPTIHGHVLSEGSRAPAEENHVQSCTALLPATADVVEVVVLDKSAVALPKLLCSVLLRYSNTTKTAENKLNFLSDSVLCSTLF